VPFAGILLPGSEFSGRSKSACYLILPA